MLWEPSYVLLKLLAMLVKGELHRVIAFYAA